MSEWAITITSLLAIIIAAFALEFLVSRLKTNRSLKKVGKADVMKAVIHATIFVVCATYLVLLFAIRKDETLVQEVSDNIYKILPLYIIDNEGSPDLPEGKYVQRNDDTTVLFYEKDDKRIGMVEAANDRIEHEESNRTPYHVEEVVTKETEVNCYFFWRIEKEEQTVTRYIVYVPTEAILYSSNF